jgi:glycine oxidase
VFDQNHQTRDEIVPSQGTPNLDGLHDVLIVGAGLIGSAIAWLLAKSGCGVVLLDAGKFGGEASSAGAGMLALGGEHRFPSPTAQLAIQSLAMYPAFVAELERESNIAIDYRTCGAIELAYESECWLRLQTTAAVQRKFGIAVDSLCVSVLSTLAPGLNLDGLCGALFYPKEGRVAPADLLAALRVACQRRGVTILEGSPVERADIERSRIVLKLRERRICGKVLVLAAGAWSSLIPLSRSRAAIRIPRSFPVKGHLLGYQLPRGSLLPILRHRQHYIVQRTNGFTVVGSSEERCGFDRSVELARIHEISAGVGAFYTPVSLQEPTRKWVGFRPGIETREPAIRQLPATKVWLAYGHYRNGILLTPVTAHLVAGGILGRTKRLHMGVGTRSEASF